MRFQYTNTLAAVMEVDGKFHGTYASIFPIAVVKISILDVALCLHFGY